MPAQIGVTGLAVMGANLARNFARNGYTVALHNRSVGKTDALLEAHGDEGDFIRTESLEELVANLETPRRVLIMVKAGSPVDSVIDQLVPLLEEGDVVIDAGNSHYTDTRRREASLAEKGLHFVGIGVSGGEEGALLGPSIMPGGSAESYKSLGPMLEKISAKADDGAPCCAWISTDGAGHFVKMVHNGIEYADMQVIGEAYDLMRNAADIEPAKQAEIFNEWNQGELSSFLIEITAEVLGHVDASTGKPLVDVIQDSAGQKGTGRWTVQSGLDMGSPVSAIAESVFARSLSSQRDIRAVGQQALTGETAEVALPENFVEDVRQALFASKLVSYAQGIDMLTSAAGEYNWELKLDEIAGLWREGCIIRAALLKDITAAYSAGEKPSNLLFAPAFAEAINKAVPAWRRVVSVAVQLGIPAPVFSSSLAYYDGLRRDRLPAALTQGLRDYFGAHTYRRTDKEGTFHTQWSGDRTEIAAEDTH
ncbi:6-phosphogluconate dehydrogenase (decarboxylating) [Glutamicibacter mysorens]|uniref:6-phosphogluconate dehydrogenase, decarboxylating n=1 Tax=Glutamicibacter mysorens TaxID=257984 RepID=A0ABX4MWL0_9MICC|nr:NADP-dependent phosphogluconate dehydrogenase [Glutamicibacter mysorens]PJJ43750.1 6-phosphogluconate dehydrogenase (decarboxylating) [Glutamicibacter mysorens]